MTFRKTNAFSISLNDPGVSLDPRIRKITGLKQSDLKHQSADWVKVAEMIDSCDLVIAHNAAFDRPFIERFAKCSGRSIWACTLKQIDWLEFGFPSSSLTMLAAYHGLFSVAHRALADSDMLIKVLQANPKYLIQLHGNAHASRVRLRVTNSNFDQRMKLRGMGFSWLPESKSWQKLILKKDLESEVGALRAVFDSYEPNIEVDDIPLADNFK